MDGVTLTWNTGCPRITLQFWSVGKSLQIIYSSGLLHSLGKGYVMYISVECEMSGLLVLVGGIQLLWSFLFWVF